MMLACKLSLRFTQRRKRLNLGIGFIVGHCLQGKLPVVFCAGNFITGIAAGLRHPKFALEISPHFRGMLMLYIQAFTQIDNY